MFKLYKPEEEYRTAFYNMAYDYKNSSDEDKRYYKDLEKLRFDYSKYVKRLHEHARGVNIPTGLVPYDTYWMMEDDKKQILAVSRLRHRLNQRSIIEGGHIGYDVPPSLRRNGYATELLRLTLEKAAERGLQKVLVTCDYDNEGSKKVILKNGGILEDRRRSDYSGKLVNRYWIEIK